MTEWEENLYQTHRVHNLNFSIDSRFEVINHHSIIDIVEKAVRRKKANTSYTFINEQGT